LCPADPRTQTSTKFATEPRPKRHAGGNSCWIQRKDGKIARAAHVDIAAAIARAQGDRTERNNITQDYVLESIFEAMERCKQADSFNATGVFKGAELLGKHLGMFQGENQGVTVNLPFDGWRIERAIVHPDTQP
jgi:hypothetical protein